MPTAPPPPLPPLGFQGALIIALFLAMIALMYTRRISALLALPLLGIGIGLIGAPPYAEAWTALGAGGLRAAWETLALKTTIIDDIIGKGSSSLAGAYTIAIIGGMLAIMIKEKKIAETLIKCAAELSGDSPIKVSVLMMFVVALLFTGMGGLGAIIMTGTIIFPIMMSLGVAPLTAAGVFLIGMCAGGTLNPQSWKLYEEALGLRAEQVQTFAFITMVLYFVTGVVFLAANTRRSARYWAAAQAVTAREGVRPIALIAPIVPIMLSFKLAIVANIVAQFTGLRVPADQIAAGAQQVWFIRCAEFWDTYIGGWDYAGAFFAGLLFTFLVTYERGKPNVRTLTRAIIVGAESVIPAVLLMIGLGIVLAGLKNETVAAHLDPFVQRIVPASRWGYVIVFSILAPLALYRGPLNVWGLGLGVAGLLHGAGQMTALPVMAILMSAGALQGVCDPTNTHNIWIASYLGEDVMKITKKTLPYIWGMAIIGLIIAALLFHDQFGPAAYQAEQALRAQTN